MRKKLTEIEKINLIRDMSDFPSELLATAQPLIGFYGLDLNVSSHKAIYDSFNRIERFAIKTF